LIDDANAVLVDNVAAVSTATYDITFAEQSEIIEVGTSTAMMDLLEVSTKADEGITIDLATTAANTLGITLNEEEVIAIDAAAIQAITQAIELIEGSALSRNTAVTRLGSNTSASSHTFAINPGNNRLLLFFGYNQGSTQVLYNGVPGTLFAQSDISGRPAIYYWLESQLPASGTHSFTGMSTRSITALRMAVAYSNVNQSTPLHDLQSLTKTSSTYSTTALTTSNVVVATWVQQLDQSGYIGYLSGQPAAQIRGTGQYRTSSGGTYYNSSFLDNAGPDNTAGAEFDDSVESISITYNTSTAQYSANGRVFWIMGA